MQLDKLLSQVAGKGIPTAEAITEGGEATWSPKYSTLALVEEQSTCTKQRIDPKELEGGFHGALETSGSFTMMAGIGDRKKDKEDSTLALVEEQATKQRIDTDNTQQYT